MTIPIPAPPPKKKSKKITPHRKNNMTIQITLHNDIWSAIISKRLWIFCFPSPSLEFRFAHIGSGCAPTSSSWRHSLTAVRKPVGEFLTPNSRRSAFPLLYFMRIEVRARQMVFLRNYYVLIHGVGACCWLPLFPPYWEVTGELTEQGECMNNRREEGGLEGGKPASDGKHGI